MKRWLLLFLLLPLFATAQTPVSPVGPKQNQSYLDNVGKLWFFIGGSTWFPLGTPFTNPMTTTGDIIVGGTAGVPTRMAMGTGSTGGGGINNTFLTVNPTGTGLEYKALFSGAGLAGSFSQGNLLLFLKDNTIIATDANISSTDLTASTLFELPTITANRTIDVGAVSNYTGQRITFWNKSTSGFTWSFIGTTVVSPSGVSALTVPSNSIVQIQSDGTQWVATTNSPITSLSNGLRVSGGVGKLGGNLTGSTTIDTRGNLLQMGNITGIGGTTHELNLYAAGGLDYTYQTSTLFGEISSTFGDCNMFSNDLVTHSTATVGTTISPSTYVESVMSVSTQDGSTQAVHVGTGNGNMYLQDDILLLGAVYHDNYAANGVLNDRWIPDWGAVKAYVASGAPTIYTANGSLTSNRSVNLNGFTLGFSGNINVNGGTLGRGTGADTSSFGFNAFSTSSYPAGKFNVYFGGRALQSNTTGTQNTAVGISAMAANTTGGLNVSVGTSALTANISGSSNVSVGVSSLTSNTTGSFNTSIGRNSLFTSTTASFNNAFGFDALEFTTTGFRNAAFGSNSLFANTTGHNNTAIGDSTLRFVVTGNNNTALGSRAGASTTGTGNLFLGYNSGFSETGSNTLYIANSSTATPLIKGDFSAETVQVFGTMGSWTPIGTAGTDSVMVKHGNSYYAVSPTYYGTSTSVPSAANPTASLGLTAINGSAATYMRSDGAPALSQSITPTWTGLHTFNQAGNATTSADVISVGTSTVATSGVPQQYSGGVNIFGYGWNTGGTPASHIMNFRMQVEPQTGSVDLGYLRFLGSTNGGAYSNLFTVSTVGNFVVPAGNFTLNKGFIAAVSTDGLVLDGVAAATVGNPIQKSTRVREQAGIWNTKATAATNYSSISFDMSGISSNAPVGKLAYYGGLSTTTTVTQTEIMDLFHYGAISLLPQAATINAWANNTEASATGAILNIGGATLTDGITAASTTLTYGFGSSISAPTFAATNTGEVITNAATLHVGPAPVAGTNVTITNGSSLLVDGNVNVQNLTASQPVFTDANKNLVSSTLLTPTLVSSAAGTLTLATGIDYEFTGTTTTWTLPAPSASLNGRAYQITIKNAGSGSITLNSASGSQIYDTSLVASLTITAGSSVTLMPDGTRFLRE